MKITVCATLLLVLLAAAAPAVLADVSGFPFSSMSTVCDRWNADFPTTASAPFSSASVTGCSVGATTAAAQTEALRTVNLFRWVSGLEPLAADNTENTNTTAAALLCLANNKLQHGGWPTSSTCFTNAGNTGTAQSNLAMGGGTLTPRFMVELWVDDDGVSSLGHRRWILGYQTAATSFGYANSTSGAAAALYTQIGSGGVAPTSGYTSFPPRGWMPSWINGVRTWHVSTPDVGKIKTCLVKTCPGNVLVSSTCTTDSGGYGGFGLVAIIIPLTTDAAVGYYNVLIEYEHSSNSSLSTQIAYTTKIVDCANTASFNGTCNIDPQDINKSGASGNGGNGGNDNAAASARANFVAVLLLVAVVAALAVLGYY